MAADNLDQKVTVQLALDAIVFDFGTLTAMWDGWKARLRGEKLEKPAKMPVKPDLLITAGGDGKLTCKVARDGFPVARAKPAELEGSKDLVAIRRIGDFLKSVDDRERLLEPIGALLIARFEKALKAVGDKVAPVQASSLIADYAKESGLPAEVVTFLPQLVKGKLVSCPRGKVPLEEFISP